MPNLILNNVTLAFTNCMTKPSCFGGYNFSFIVDKTEFCNAVRETLATQKTQMWDAKKNTDAFIIQKCNAKTKDSVTHEEVAGMMKDTDLLVQVKSKEAPIVNTKNIELGRGTTADILIDVFEYVYNKREWICIRSHADRYCTVRVVNLVRYNGGVKGFEMEPDAMDGINKDALENVEVFDAE